jgi:hypothetical protein
VYLLGNLIVSTTHAATWTPGNGWQSLDFGPSIGELTVSQDGYFEPRCVVVASREGLPMDEGKSVAMRKSLCRNWVWCWRICYEERSVGPRGTMAFLPSADRLSFHRRSSISTIVPMMLILRLISPVLHLRGCVYTMQEERY